MIYFTENDRESLNGGIIIPKKTDTSKNLKMSKIVDAAEKIFFSKGYQNSSMEDVAKEAEVAKGTIYLYFKSKRGLYFAIGFRALNTMLDMFREAISTKKTGNEKVIALGLAFSEYCNKYPDYYSFIIKYQAEGFEKKPLEREVVQSYRASKELFLLVVNSVKEGIKDGSIISDLDPVTLAVVLWCQTSGVVQLAGLKESFFNFFSDMNSEKIVQTHINYTEKSLRGN